MHSAEPGMASTFYVDIFGGKHNTRMFASHSDVCVFHVAKEIGSTPALFVIMCTVVNWCFLCSLSAASLVSMLRAVAACTLFAGSFLF
jgi:uncharacterized membrane protein (DUF106 family)